MLFNYFMYAHYHTYIHTYTPTMEYDLIIESDVDITLDPRETYTISFKPRGNAPMLGSETQCLSMMTLLHIQKIIASEIKFFHKKNMDPTKIQVHYLGHKLDEGKVLESICRIDATHRVKLSRSPLPN